MHTAILVLLQPAARLRVLKRDHGAALSELVPSRPSVGAPSDHYLLPCHQLVGVTGSTNWWVPPLAPTNGCYRGHQLVGSSLVTN